MTESQAGTFVIGLTGSIGSGKSAVAALLAKLGATVVDADVLAREIVEPGKPALRKIVKAFGETVLNPDKTLNRKALGEIIFSDREKRTVLEAITHPKIRELWLEKLAEAKASGSSRIIVYVVPLLFESKKRYPELDKILVVAASERTCLYRIMARDKLTEEQAFLRIRSQLPISEKIKKADFVVMNEGDLRSLEEQVLEVYSEILAA